MHLVIPTYLSLFWVICHPNRTFSLKEFGQEPQNRLCLLPIARPYPLLPLTHDPPLLYWLGTGWWCLGLMCALLPYVSMACLLLMRLPWLESSSVHFAAHSWPLVMWMVLWAFAFYISLLSWVGPCSIVAFSFFSPFFALVIGLLALLPYHSVTPTTLLCDSCLLGFFFGSAVYFPFA